MVDKCLCAWGRRRHNRHMELMGVLRMLRQATGSWGFFSPCAAAVVCDVGFRAVCCISTITLG